MRKQKLNFSNGKIKLLPKSWRTIHNFYVQLRVKMENELPEICLKWSEHQIERK